MNRLKVGLAIVGCVLAIGGAAIAQPPMHGQDARATDKMLTRVLKLFGGDEAAIGAEDLAESFAKQVPIERLRRVAAQIRAGEGALTLETIAQGASERALVANVIGSKKGTPLTLRSAIDEQGRISGLLIQPGMDKRAPELKSWDDLKERLGTAAEKTALTLQELVEVHTTGDEPDGTKPPGAFTLESRVFHRSTEPLAIGSAFKLWTLGALAMAVEAGDARWDQQLKIQDAAKSLPSGVMQNEPEGKGFTLRQFAEKMISISDNTAADHLIDTLGRDRCERCMSACCRGHSELNKPFLTTRDLFALKLSGSDDLPKRYLLAGETTRRELVMPSGDVGKARAQAVLAAAWKAPRFIDSIEWFASGQDMVNTMALLDDLSRRPGLAPVREILAINPGIPLDRKVWTYAGYKGGSEPGVLSLTWLLERTDGRRFVLSITFNDTKRAIDEPLGIALAARAVELLGKWDMRSGSKTDGK